MKKAISPILSQTIFIVLALVFMTIIIFLYFSLEKNISEKVSKQDFEKIAKELIVEINKEKITFSNDRTIPEINKTLLLGTNTLYLPEKVFGKNYIIEFYSSGEISTDYPNSFIKIYSVNSPEVYHEESLSLKNTKISGKLYVKNGKVKLKYYRVNENGKVYDLIVVGDLSIVG